MTSAPWICAALRVHRRPKKLRILLDSLPKDTRGWELLVIQDDPTDVLSQGVLEKARTSGCPLRIVHVPGKGWPGCNQYLDSVPALTQAPWLTYIDDDDRYVYPAYLHELLAQIHQAPNARMLITKFRQYLPNGRFNVIPSGFGWGVAPMRCNIGTPCLCVLREVMDGCSWAPTPTGDYDCIQEAFLKAGSRHVQWFPVVGVETQGPPSFGATEY